MHRLTSRIPSVRTTLAVIMLASTGCSSDATDPAGDSSPVGTYALVSVAGRSLPTVLSQSGGSTTEVVSLSLSLMTGGTFSSVGQFRMGQAGQGPQPTQIRGSGTWVATGENITITEDGDALTGTWGNDRLSLTTPFGIYVFEK